MALGSYSDIATIKVTISSASSVIVNQSSLTYGSSGWSGTFTGLPTGIDLTFEAEAFNSSGTKIFFGSTSAALSGGLNAISIGLDAIDDGIPYSLPSLHSIVFSSQVVADSATPVTINIRGTAGSTVYWVFDMDSGEGAFSPSSGSVVLDSAGRGSASTSYSSPATPGTITGAIGLEDDRHQKSGQDFVIQVVPSPLSSGGVTINIGPAVYGLFGYRDSANQVTFTAMVADDDESSLSYVWEYDGTTFGTARSSSMAYSESMHGTITARITDPDGLSTTITYSMPAMQFPDNPVVVMGNSLDSIALFTNESFVDYSPGDYSSEARNVELLLGTYPAKSVLPFTGYTAADFSAALSGRNALLVPEQENNTLSYYLGSAEILTLQNYVYTGGTVIVFDDASLINAILGTSISSAGTAGTSYPGSDLPDPGTMPASLPYRDHTVRMTGLPSNAQIWYSDSIYPTVFSIPHGSGQVYYLGWDWYDAAPNGSYGGSDWNLVLDRVLANGGGSSGDIEVSYWIQNGPEQPDYAEGLTLQYLNSSGSWIDVNTFLDTNYSEVVYEGTLTIRNLDAHHSGFKLRFYQGSHSGSYCDYFYVDNVSVSKGGVVRFTDDFDDLSNWSVVGVISTDAYAQSGYSALFYGDYPTPRYMESTAINLSY